jgi:thioester reductase-like protein
VGFSRCNGIGSVELDRGSTTHQKHVWTLQNDVNTARIEARNSGEKNGYMLKSAGQDRPFVFLTGATGLVGGLVLARLLSCELPVAVLVRGNRRQSAHERMESLMRRLEERCGRLFVRPVVLDGELCSAGLGLSEADRAWLIANCGSVIHSAANLLFKPASEHPENEPYRTNVDGTRHLLELTSSAGINEWHYVSTAYIAGLRTGRILERESNVGQEFGNDYERSKTMSEQMLRQSQQITSLTVYRPSIVIDLHPTTSMRSDQTINSAFVMFQALSQRFGLPERGDWFRRLGFSGHERKNIVTVDWVAAMIAEIYRRPALHGETYHLTSADGTSAAELEDGFRAAVLEGGVKLPSRRVEATSQIDEQAAPFVAAFKPYFKDDPVFDRTNTVHAMQVCNEADLPPLTVERLRDFCMRQTKHGGPPTVLRLTPSAWDQFRLDCERTMDQADSLPANVFGIEVCGSCGGQWVVEENRRGWRIRTAHAGSAPSRIIVSSAVFGDLTSGSKTAAQVYAAGVLLIESDLRHEGNAFEDQTVRPGASTDLLDSLTRLMAAVQRHANEFSTRTEVAYVR